MTTKVFVGNLAFQTTDQALAEAFQDCGKVKSGVVITRGRRSLGYGFVEFESPDSAIDAVKLKNNTLLKGRTLKVELASDNPVRSINPGDPTQQQQRSGGGGGGGITVSNNDGPNNLSGNGPARRRKRNNRRRRSTGPPGQAGSKSLGGDNHTEGGIKNNPSGAPGGNKNPGERGSGPGGMKPRGDRDQPRDRGDRDQPRGDRDQPRDRGDRDQPRDRGDRDQQRNPRRRNIPQANNDDRVLSKTAVFVANLPFTVKDEDLLTFFKDNNPKAAHVVVTRNGRSRGYGFVDFELERDQQAAIATKNNAKFVIGDADRVITVTPSYKTQEVTPEI